MTVRQARDQLIEDHELFVRKIVSRTVKNLSLPLDSLDDYYSAGFLGLVEAAERYDLREGGSFKSYAFLRIRGAVIDHIRKQSEITGRAYRYVRALKAMENSEHNIMSEFKNGSQSPTKILARIFQFAAQGAITFRLSSGESQEMIEQVADKEANPEQQLHLAQYSRALRSCIDRLPERERFIIEQYYYQDKSFVELMEERPELSKSWISKLHTRAIARLTRLMTERVREAA